MFQTLPGTTVSAIPSAFIAQCPAVRPTSASHGGFCNRPLKRTSFSSGHPRATPLYPSSLLSAAGWRSPDTLNGGSLEGEDGVSPDCDSCYTRSVQNLSFCVLMLLSRRLPGSPSGKCSEHTGLSCLSLCPPLPCLSVTPKVLWCQRCDWKHVPRGQESLGHGDFSALSGRTPFLRSPLIPFLVLPEQ